MIARARAVPFFRAFRRFGDRAPSRFFALLTITSVCLAACGGGGGGGGSVAPRATATPTPLPTRTTAPSSSSYPDGRIDDLAAQVGNVLANVFETELVCRTVEILRQLQADVVRAWLRAPVA